MTDYKPTDFTKTSVADYSNNLGSNAPTPGGGSAAGVVLSLATNAAAKAAVFSDIDNNEQVKLFFDNCKKISQLGLELAANDEKTFLLWKQMRGLPKETEEEKTLRTAKINDAVKQCISVPYTLAKTSQEFINTLHSFIPLCNKWLLSDLLVANSFAYSSYQCALYNIDINMSYLKDEQLKSQIIEYVNSNKDKVKNLYESIIEEVK